MTDDDIYKIYGASMCDMRDHVYRHDSRMPRILGGSLRSLALAGPGPVT